MKIGIVFGDSISDGGGVQQYVRIIGDWLISKGHDVKFLVSESENDMGYGDRVIELSKNIPINLNKSRHTTPVQPYISKIIATIIEEKFDILHVQMPYSPLMAQLVLALADVPKVGTFHSYSESFLLNISTSVLSVIQRDQIKSFYKVMTVSEAASKFIESSFNLPSEILPMGINLKKIIGEGKLKEFDDGKLNLMYFGRLSERKGVIHLLKAYERVVKMGRLGNTRLIIAGDGPLKSELKKYVKTNKIPEVVFTGYVPEERKKDYYSTADVCIFPATEGESFGIVLIEALANGKPVVAGHNDGYKTVLRNTGSLLLIDPKDTDLFAQKLISLIENFDLRKIFSAWAQKESEKYDIDKHGEKLLKIYHEAIASYQKKGVLGHVVSPFRFIAGILYTLIFKIFVIFSSIYRFFKKKK